MRQPSKSAGSMDRCTDSTLPEGIASGHTNAVGVGRSLVGGIEVGLGVGGAALQETRTAAVASRTMARSNGAPLQAQVKCHLPRQPVARVVPGKGARMHSPMHYGTTQLGATSQSLGLPWQRHRSLTLAG